MFHQSSFVAAALSTAILLAACEAAGPGPRTVPVTVLFYNAQALFDDRDDGGEYAEASVAGGRWDSARYAIRLDNLARVISSVGRRGPDIVALAEVENRRVLTDLVARHPELAAYRYAVIGEAHGAAPGALRCAILSRYPVMSARAVQATRPPARRRAVLRPALEAEIDAGGAALRLFVAHWKSKVEGAAATEPDRVAQAAALAARLRAILAEDPTADILVVGDLNENPDEYERVGRAYPTALMPTGAEADTVVSARDATSPGILVTASKADAGLRLAHTARGARVALWSPWFGAAGGSYAFRGRMERIDHALCAPGLFDARGLTFREFSVHAPEFLLDDSGLPIAWDAARRAGFSDHLPVLVGLDRH